MSLPPRRNLTEIFESMEDVTPNVINSVSSDFDDHTISEHINCQSLPDLVFNEHDDVFLMNYDDYKNTAESVYAIPMSRYSPLCETLQEKRQAYFYLLLRQRNYLVLTTETGNYAISECRDINEMLEEIFPHGRNLNKIPWEEVMEIGYKLNLALVIIPTPPWDPEDNLGGDDLRTIDLITRAPIRVFDSIALEENPLNRFLNESDDMVFLILDESTSEPRSLAYSLSRKQVVDMFNDKKYYFPCKKPARGLYPRLDEIQQDHMLFRLPLGGQIYVKAGQVLEVMEKFDEDDVRLFAVRSYSYEIPYTTSAESVRISNSNYSNFRGEDIDALGADHCQDGSNKMLYEILEVNSQQRPNFDEVLSPGGGETPEAIRERRTRLQSIERRMQDARQAGDHRTMMQLMRERHEG